MKGSIHKVWRSVILYYSCNRNLGIIGNFPGVKGTTPQATDSFKALVHRTFTPQKQLDPSQSKTPGLENGHGQGLVQDDAPLSCSRNPLK